MTGCAVVGAAVSPFGRFDDISISSLGGGAATAALADAGLTATDIDFVLVANSFGGIVSGQTSIVGQVLCSKIGVTGVPVFNIDNACAGSSSALGLAVQAVRAGAASNVLVLGVEKMLSPDRSVTFRSLNGATDPEFLATLDVDLNTESIYSSVLYPQIIARYTERFPVDAKTLAGIAVKNRANAARNPCAAFTEPLTPEEVLSSRTIAGPLTALMCAPPVDGAAALVVSAHRGANRRAVPILSSEFRMGFGPGGTVSSVARVATLAYQAAGLGPADVDVAELSDSTAFSELRAYEEMGFCEPGGGTALVEEGATSLEGRIPVNTGGGLESRGHPSAASGAAQIVEIVTQLRGEAGGRQVPDAVIGLAESAGGFAGGDSAAIAVTILGRSGHRPGQ